MITLARSIVALLVPLALVLSATPADAAPRAEIQRYTFCVTDDVNGGQVCGRVILHGGSSGQQRDAWSDKTRSHLRSNYVRLHTSYAGWSTKDISDGVDVFSVKSRKYANRYHLYVLQN